MQYGMYIWCKPPHSALLVKVGDDWGYMLKLAYVIPALCDLKLAVSPGCGICIPHLVPLEHS